MTQTRTAVAWTLLAALAFLMAYAGFRGYFNPELLIGFANHLAC